MSQCVLIVEDERVQQRMLKTLLEQEGFSTICCENGADAITYMQRDDRVSIDLVLCDLFMPQVDGQQLLRHLKKEYPHLPIIILTASTEMSHAVEALKSGADDFLTKPPDIARLKLAVRNALEKKELRKEVSNIRRRERGRSNFTDLIGSDGGLKETIQIGRRAASSDIPVLLMGESGVGKELFARALHGESARVDEPFIAINCGAIPENLVESTLFGHEKGAFTGAISREPGKFREANGGTLFLDEIGELPLPAQVKLLRVLQEKEVEPVGMAKPIRVDVRIISATNRDLRDEVAEWLFREDLYYRLNAMPILIPPLRSRAGDIPLLVKHFVDRFAYIEQRPSPTITEEAMQTICHYPWPGNIRELENTLFRSLLLSTGDTLDLFIEGQSTTPTAATIPVNKGRRAAKTATQNNVFHALDDTGALKDFKTLEAEIIAFYLDYFDGHVGKTAANLGISAATLYRKRPNLNQN